ncbi:acetaldehyde dehydrogenase (acetylating) [Thermanaerovibrio acidaminovorans DSM 6589]|uniref:Acetaldehyde dehydrogenase (Acetylating) n=1 Tax=Thermanaerovibrio acidaminovorans (strain ATCC 49978 / DSM 6589 / Su883) TaxID=525903 RepID=D1B7R1_THEAS|nr:acetaldehyde dehydrogenase (acetylating) [Thermanaerovibrio acidaminovorans]ACZ18314.1 acetaldehyde dehydrogenase (acetylating) [Thermanaerovibrio acidaminovorans DSM 6589]
MQVRDRDLLSRQEARDLISAARAAQRELARMDQEQIDRLVRALANAAMEEADRLGRMAHEETGYGKPEDKALKNRFAALGVYEAIKDMRTVGIIGEDPKRRVIEVAVPVGVIAALIPSTNPTSTTIFKAMIALKSANGIVFSPHPSAKGCIMETVRILSRAVEEAGGPKGIFGCMSVLSPEGTQELMRSDQVSLILATGGSAMVKAAYSSGTPAIGVGPGNTPAFIDRTAHVPQAVSRIVASKTFDYSTICASEQSVVVDRKVEAQVREEFVRQGGYFLPPEDAERVARTIFLPSGLMNPRTVGRSPRHIAEMAGISIPEGTRLLLAEGGGVGKEYPFSQEKLCPVLAFYAEDGWEACCELCIRLLDFEGAGHTLAIHSNDMEVIRQFGLKKPVSRVIVNAGSALGAVGATTNLLPSMTLGCGAAGHNATSDNVGPLHLINVRRVAWGVREIEDLSAPGPREPGGRDLDRLVDRITEEILRRLQA